MTSTDAKDVATSLDQLGKLEQWTTQGTKEVYRYGKWLKIEHHEVKLPNGKVIDDWSIVQSPQFVNVAIVTEEGKWVLFHQTKYAIGHFLGKDSLAPVGGLLETGEDPLETAKREAKEETGYVSDNWVHLTSGVADANRGSGVGHLYLCLDARFVGCSESDDLEEQRPLLLSTEQVEDAVLQGRFLCHSWAATMATSLIHYRRHQARQAASS